MSLDSHFKQGPMFGCSGPQCCCVHPPEDTDHCPECMVEWPCEVEELRQAYDRMWEWHNLAAARAERAEAALARVRALCDEVETYDHPVAWHTEIRAAIEGDQ